MPFDPAAEWNSEAHRVRKGRQGSPVHAQSGGTAFNRFVVARAGKFWLLLPPAVREELGITDGDTAPVTLRPA